MRYTATHHPSLHTLLLRCEILRYEWKECRAEVNVDPCALLLTNKQVNAEIVRPDHLRKCQKGPVPTAAPSPAVSAVIRHAAACTLSGCVCGASASVEPFVSPRSYI